jgi:hypothetical protein
VTHTGRTTARLQPQRTSLTHELPSPTAMCHQHPHLTPHQPSCCCCCSTGSTFSGLVGCAAAPWPLVAPHQPSAPPPHTYSKLGMVNTPDNNAPVLPSYSYLLLTSLHPSAAAPDSTHPHVAPHHPPTHTHTHKHQFKPTCWLQTWRQSWAPPPCSHSAAAPCRALRPAHQSHAPVTHDSSSSTAQHTSVMGKIGRLMGLMDSWPLLPSLHTALPCWILNNCCSFWAPGTVKHLTPRPQHSPPQPKTL